ncbi:unnamed protein product [Brassica napus]|uniref:(rape) hypothetical protein n=1 Tax=Brassica napus TaxID=3708 RepID=A0A816QCU9_BRANA|nr:unnamed protein product [Brassica napus]
MASLNYEIFEAKKLDAEPENSSTIALKMQITRKKKKIGFDPVAKRGLKRVGKIRLLSTAPTSRTSLDITKTKRERISKLPAG